MNLYITYVTHKDAILDVKVQVPCNGLLRSNFSEKEEATWIKIGEDYNFIQLGDWVSLALLLWLVIYNSLEANWLLLDLFVTFLASTEEEEEIEMLLENYLQRYSSHPSKH